MNPLKTLTGVLTGALLLAPAAGLAEHGDDERRWQPASAVQLHVHSHDCNHAPAPPAGDARNPGRYELRTVSKWVPGYHAQVWVPEQCRPHRFKSRMKCRGGHYAQQWIEGYHAQVQEYVWVPAPRPVYRHHSAAPAVGFHLSAAF